MKTTSNGFSALQAPFTAVFQHSSIPFPLRGQAFTTSDWILSLRIRIFLVCELIDRAGSRWLPAILAVLTEYLGDAREPVAAAPD
jgi:hypothetical protein